MYYYVDMNDEPEAAEKPSYTLSLKGEGITIDQKITLDVALAVINVALGGGAVTPPKRAASSLDAGTDTTVGGGIVADSRLTAGEYIESVNAGTNPEKITAFGMFLQDTRGQENFTREDIRSMFRSAHEPAPANFGRDFRSALTYHWIAPEGDSSDRYFVTNSGKKAVADHFSTPRSRAGRRRATRTQTGGDDD
jgi:hypothetical protein